MEVERYYILRQGSPERKWEPPICKGCGIMVRATQYYDEEFQTFCCGRPGCVTKWKQELGKITDAEANAEKQEADLGIAEVEHDAELVRKSYNLQPTQDEIDELMSDD